MGAALHLLSSGKANITGGAFESLSAIGGDSLSLFAFPSGSRAWMIHQWAYASAHKAEFDTRSPRLHDNTRGIRVAQPLAPGTAAANGAFPVWPIGAKQPLYSSDTLIQEVNGTATDNALLSSLIYYENLPGVQANLVTWPEIESRIVNLVGIRVAPTAGTAVFGTAVTLTSTEDRLQADISYALLGYATDVAIGTFGIKGPDTGNLRVGGPGIPNGDLTGQWFKRLSLATGIPTIPVIQANNRGTTVIDTVDTQGNTASGVDLVFAELM